ncbi:hypothetical protein PG991_013602 [Apiospora marii]|uniref:Uncharacterized protein n=1 Tax=Apiospora marii TaxID=335849 RepID=A0ABR1R7F6_9PEZI
MRPVRQIFDPGSQDLVDVPQRGLVVEEHVVEHIAQFLQVGIGVDLGQVVVRQGARDLVAALQGKLGQRVWSVAGRDVLVVGPHVGQHRGALVVPQPADFHVAAAVDVRLAPGQVPARTVDEVGACKNGGEGTVVARYLAQDQRHRACELRLHASAVFLQREDGDHGGSVLPFHRFCHDAPRHLDADFIQGAVDAGALQVELVALLHDRVGSIIHPVCVNRRDSGIALGVLVTREGVVASGKIIQIIPPRTTSQPAVTLQLGTTYVDGVGEGLLHLLLAHVQARGEVIVLLHLFLLGRLLLCVGRGGRLIFRLMVIFSNLLGLLARRMAGKVLIL